MHLLCLFSSLCLILAQVERIKALHSPLPRRQALASAAAISSGILSRAVVPAVAAGVNDDLARLQQTTAQACTVLEEALSRSDYSALMSLTREYDLELRKAGMGKIKKTYSPNDASAQDPTVLTNAVTFDLIGINKNARPGSENPDGVAKYITELRTDIDKFVALYREG